MNSLTVLQGGRLVSTTSATFILHVNIHMWFFILHKSLVHFLQILPDEFINKFSEIVPEKIYVHVPGKVTCPVRFVKQGGYIEGLEMMMQFYALQKNNMVLLKFIGGQNFGIHVFDSDGGQIKYGENIVGKTNYITTCTLPKTGKITKSEMSAINNSKSYASMFFQIYFMHHCFHI